MRKIFHPYIPIEKRINQIYRMNFDTPSPECNPLHFFQYREQIILIENAISHSSHNSLRIIDLRSYISLLLKSKSKTHSQKMSELGAILFYLNYKKHLPQLVEKKWFISILQEDMDQKIKDLKSNRDTLHHEKLSEIPSGKTHYLLSIFSQMMISKNQKLSRGGIFLIIELLKSEKSTIARHLKPEHRQHILLSLHQLCYSNELKTLIETRIPVHRDMQLIVRLTLKLSPYAPVTSIQAAQASMMALLSDLRQKDNEPNCYAVAALIFVSVNRPYIFLSQLIDWLKQGSYSVANSIRIPIIPLVKHRLSHAEPSNVELSPSSIVSLPIVQDMFSLLGLMPPKYAKNTFEKSSLLEWLQKNIPQQHLTYSLLLIESYTCNPLINMALAISEFHSTNITEEITSTCTYSVDKRYLIDHIISFIQNECKSLPINLNQLPSFSNLIKDHLEKHIWLQDHVIQSVQDHDNVLTFHLQDSRKMLIPNQSLSPKNSLSEVLQIARLVLYVSNHGDISYLHSFSEFTEILTRIIEQLMDNLDEETQSLAREMNKCLTKRAWTVSLAHFATNTFPQKKMDLHLLKNHNLFVLFSSGGLFKKITHNLFQIPSYEMLLRCTSPTSFFRQLYSKLRVQPVKTYAHTSAVLCKTAEHSFIMPLPYLETIIGSPHQFNVFFSEFFQEPTERFLSNKVSKSRAEQVIRTCACDSDAATNLLKQLPKNLTFKTLREHIFAAPDCWLKSKKRVRAIIDTAFSKINIDSLNIVQIFKSLDIPNVCSPHQVQEELKKKFGNTWIYPFQIAYQLRKLFTASGIQSFETHKIEHEICKSLQYPYAYILADYNWYISKKEAPRHIHLIIRSHLGSSDNQLSLFVRDNMHEMLEDASEFRLVTLMFPLPSSKTCNNP